MFKGMGNIAGMMQQASQMGTKMKELQARLAAERVTGEAGGGMVAVEMSGAMQVVSVRIDPGLVERSERELIEDLVVTATNEAASKAKQLYADAMQEVTGGLNLPGMGDVLSKITGGQQ